MVLYCWNMIDVYINKYINCCSDLNGVIMVNSLDMSISKQVVMFITPITGHKWLLGKTHKYWLTIYTSKIRIVFSYTSETNQFCTSESWHPVQCSLSFRAMMYTTHWILTHQSRVTHICVGKLTIISSDNGLSPARRQAIIWTNAGISLIGPLGTNFSENLVGIQTFSFEKMHLKMSSAKWRTFCLGHNVLSPISQTGIKTHVYSFRTDKDI